MTKHTDRAPAAPGEYDGEAVVFIPLTQGQTAIVDADIYPRIVADYGLRWSACNNGRGYVNARRSVRTPEGWRELTLARAVIMPGEDDEVRAKNGDALDCRLSNLTTAPRCGHKMRSRRGLRPEAA